MRDLHGAGVNQTTPGALSVYDSVFPLNCDANPRDPILE